MKKILLVLMLGAIAYFGYERLESPPVASTPAEPATHAALDSGASGKQVQGVGLVEKVLPDDDEGSRHQRFILRIPSGQTLLIAHNIDLAPRISDLAKGDSVEYNGEFEWNPKGGVVHWTHRDPANRHVAGWLKHKGRMFQ